MLQKFPQKQFFFNIWGIPSPVSKKVPMEIRPRAIPGIPQGGISESSSTFFLIFQRIAAEGSPGICKEITYCDG